MPGKILNLIYEIIFNPYAYRFRNAMPNSKLSMID